MPNMQRMGMRTPSTQNPTQVLILSQFSWLVRLVALSSTIGLWGCSSPLYTGSYGRLVELLSSTIGL